MAQALCWRDPGSTSARRCEIRALGSTASTTGRSPRGGAAPARPAARRAAARPRPAPRRSGPLRARPEVLEQEGEADDGEHHGEEDDHRERVAAAVHERRRLRLLDHLEHRALAIGDAVGVLLLRDVRDERVRLPGGAVDRLALGLPEGGDRDDRQGLVRVRRDGQRRRLDLADDRPVLEHQLPHRVAVGELGVDDRQGRQARRVRRVGPRGAGVEAPPRKALLGDEDARVADPLLALPVRHATAGVDAGDGEERERRRTDGADGDDPLEAPEHTEEPRKIHRYAPLAYRW
ncbi:MAG: hypothetical protein R3C15_00760 [Thermoleophilia bacterium]